jgi:hypothetical protein
MWLVKFMPKKAAIRDDSAAEKVPMVSCSSSRIISFRWLHCHGQSLVEMSLFDQSSNQPIHHLVYPRVD